MSASSAASAHGISQQLAASAAQAAHNSKPGRQTGSSSAAHKQGRAAFSADVYIYFANLG